MSEDSKESVRKGNGNLADAFDSLEQASRRFKQAGDGKTAERIEKIKVEVDKVSTEVSEKLRPNNS